MNWTSWGLVLVVGLAAGAMGAYLHAQAPAILRLAAPYRCGRLQRLARRLRLLLRRRSLRPAVPPRTYAPGRPAATPAPRPSARPSDDAVVLMPDGRPCPIGAAVQLLELAWRWQVVHGANLPIRARHGEGAYVWRPPLPRGTVEQVRAEAER